VGEAEEEEAEVISLSMMMIGRVGPPSCVTSEYGAASNVEFVVVGARSIGLIHGFEGRA
jgi:hypothetical protein